MTAPARPPGAGCPECGRPVPPGGAKLCPNCGYPLLFDRPPAPDEDHHKVVYKPTVETPGVDVSYPLGRGPAPPAPPARPGPPPRYGAAPPPRYGGPQPVRPVGPYCPACRHGNPPHRRRCEICGQELWPGAAQPTRPAPPPPPAVAQPRRRRSWWWIALIVGVPLAAVATVWLLAFLL
jgi:hypothetical protein